MTFGNTNELIDIGQEDCVNITNVNGQSAVGRVPAVDYDFSEEDFWRQVPAWMQISQLDFGDHNWQQRNCITSVRDIEAALRGRISQGFWTTCAPVLSRTPMTIRMTPYIFSLIDWSQPEDDPVRRQFLPLGSQFLEEHPCCMDDSLDEDADRSAPFLTHRYPDKVLFLPVSVCPVYCSYCTRSRLVGGSTAVKSKSPYAPRNTPGTRRLHIFAQHPRSRMW